MTAADPSRALVLDVVGVRVEVVSPGSDELRLLLDEATGSATADCSVEVAEPDVESVLAETARAAIERSPRLLLHAGAVTCGGRAVLFPGASGTGKSTMTAACLRRGFSYLSDEMVAVDLGSGLVEGWSRPIMLTPWATEALGVGGTPGHGPGKRAVTADLLGAEVVDQAVPVAHVVVLRRTGTTGRPQPMSAGDTLAHLLAASFNHYRHGAAAWQAAVRLAGSVRGWRLDVGDLMTTADAVAGLVDENAG